MREQIVEGQEALRQDGCTEETAPSKLQYLKTGFSINSAFQLIIYFNT